MRGNWTDQIYSYPIKHKPKKEPECREFSTASTTGSALIAPSTSSASGDSSDDEYDDCRVLLWKVNPRPPNSKEVKLPSCYDFREGSILFLHSALIVL